MKNDNYRNRYQLLQARLLNGYVDFYLLEAIDLNRDKLDGNGLYAMQHLVEVLKRDLCLSLCSICYDKTNKQSNTIASLQQYIENVYMLSVNIPEFENHLFIRMKNEVKAARDTYIAHSDMHSSDGIIQLMDLKVLLDLARQAINRLCFVSFDDEVRETNDVMLAQYRIALSASIISLLQQGNKGKEENRNG